MRIRSLSVSRLLTLVPLVLVILLVSLMVACGDDSTSPDSTAPTDSPSSTAGVTTTLQTVSTVVPIIDLEPIVVPTMPDEIPGYTELDPATGLHMTGTPVEIDLAEYRLRVTGAVDNELSLTYDEIRSLPKVTATPKLVCPGFFEDTATWSGAQISAILDLAGVQPEAQRIRLNAADGYSTTMRVKDAVEPENFLAYEWEGEPLPVLHGFPLRAVFPDWFGSHWVKWLLEIEVE